MAYRHGVYIQETATGVVTPATAESTLPVFVGTAPVQNLAEGTTPPINDPKLIYSLADYYAAFGELKDTDNEEDYTLTQAAKIYLGRYGVAPAVFINVFNPETHANDGTPAPSKVTATDIIGTVSDTHQRTGLELVDEVYSRFRLNPGLILAPKYSAEPSVAIAIASKASSAAGFVALGVIDIPDTVTDYTKAPAWLNDNNLTLEHLAAFYGSAVYNGHIEPGSIHFAGCCGTRDAASDDVPYYSPSNASLMCEGLTHAGKALHFSSAEAAYLNGNGIVTGLNMIGGLRCWGDQLACYPGKTDVKDSSIPIRRMFDWIGNTLILTCWQYVSTPLRRRLIETVQDTFNIWLNGLTAKEYILGGRVAFEQADNSTTDLMDGKVTWHVYVTPPQAARELTFTLEYDPSYLETLFGTNA